MTEKLKKNKETIIIGVIGVILAFIIAFVLINNSKTTKVWVPKNNIEAGVIIKDTDLKEVDVSTSYTPGNYIKNKNVIVGKKLKNKVEAGQLLYVSDFLESWQSYTNNINVPNDYIKTSIELPDDKACGGLITAGDSVDIIGVTKQGIKVNGFESINPNGLGLNYRNNTKVDVYFILANVKIINTNSSLSRTQNNDMSKVTNKSSASGSSDYIIALCYDDYKKLLQAKDQMDLYMNICPKQNDSNPPLLNQMAGNSFSGLHDAQKQVQNKDGSEIKGNQNVTTNSQTSNQSQNTDSTIPSNSNTQNQNTNSNVNSNSSSSTSKSK
jgi:Flp pilus assembly protein CpaB